MGIHVKIGSFGKNHIRPSDVRRQRAALILAAKDMMESGRRTKILWLSDKGEVLPSSGWSKVEITWSNESPEQVYEEVRHQVELFGRIVKIVVAIHNLNAAEELWLRPSDRMPKARIRYDRRVQNLKTLQSIAERTGRQAALDWWIENT